MHIKIQRRDFLSFLETPLIQVQSLKFNNNFEGKVETN
jgi:hypothetical protein